MHTQNRLVWKTVWKWEEKGRMRWRRRKCITEEDKLMGVENVT